MTEYQVHHLNRRVEIGRRLRLLSLTVPCILNRLLKPALGWHRFPFLVAMLLSAPGYRRAFSRPDDDAGLIEVKKTFLLVGVLYQRLLSRLGEQVAHDLAYTFIFELGNSVQRTAYLPPPGTPREWAWFHAEHEAQMREGFIRNNENDGVIHEENRVSLHITRCRFFEAFRDMGNAQLTEAFCRSDETVFNEYSSKMRFHRGEATPNTIARGAARCTFIYERFAKPVAARPSVNGAVRVAE